MFHFNKYDRAQVYELQSRLFSHGFEPGPFDGIWGPKTSRAVIEFKKARGLLGRSYIGPITWGMLTGTSATPPVGGTIGAHPDYHRYALSQIGTREYQGSKHNPKILEWWQKIRAPFTDDETPWCAGFVGGCLETYGIRSTRSAAARSYEKWGSGTEYAAGQYFVGGIAVFWRGSRNGWSGHVGFVAGRDQHGNLMILGGNQGNAVNIKPFAMTRLLTIRYEPSQHYGSGGKFMDLPVVNSNGRVSTNEA